MGQLFRLDERTRPWWVLVGSCTGLFLLMLDSTIVSLALPSIQHDLGASAASLQWVMNGYLLVVAVLVVTAGRLGDQFGRRLVFLIGMVLFATGSVLAALSGDDEVLIAARVVQGAGAAAMLSLSLAIVCHAFPDSEQARALGIWAAVSAVALAIGPAVGGFLVDADWRLIFWINIPVSIAGIAIILIVLGVSETTYLVLSVIGILGGIGAGMDHSGFAAGARRGLAAGGIFGASILIAHELHGAEAKADLPDPPILLVVVTTVLAVILAGLGGWLRQRYEQRSSSP